MVKNKENWVKTGYEIFALTGTAGLKIESLAKRVGVSKSSFYHHFADMEIFTGLLLKYHIQQAYIIADKERNASSIDPELIDILVEHKTDLLFNRQLRIYREHKPFSDALVQSGKIVGNGFINIWVNDLKLNLSQQQIEGLFELALENFYLQINTANLNHRWLSTYFVNLKRIAGYFV